MTWVLANLGLIADRLLAHVAQAGIPIVAAFVLALPLAQLSLRWGPARSTVSVASGLLYAIPSLPLFIMLPLVLGTSVRSPVNIVVALTLYGLALMVPGAQQALRAVPAAARDCAEAQGFSPMHRWWAVDLPLAGPALLANLRVVAVSTISLVTVGGVLGVESLGLLFTDGFQRGIIAEIVSGIVLTVALALAVDLLLVTLGRLVMPWTRVAPSVRRPRPAEVSA